ncbi:MAG: phosphotransferase [Chloroflexota bacterium]|nr:phosphotransferase [Chloroflexota bacterium]
MNAELRRAPAPRALAALCVAIQPGGRVGTVRRLRGGISSGMHAVELIAPSGERRHLVVRRYGASALREDPRIAEREWSALGALSRAGLPAPRPIWLDRDGAVFGCPTMVTSRLPGRGLLAPRNLAGWLRQLAEALAQVHLASFRDAELASLLDQRTELARLLERDAPPPGLARQPDGLAVWSALHRWWPHVDASASSLVHGDYWPGNTLWRYGRLTGIIDWEQARRGNPDQDVGYCRLDLAFLRGPEAADAFLGAYEAAAGRAVGHLFFWELYAVARALGSVEQYVSGYVDLGRHDVTVDETRARLAHFAAAALAHAAGGPGAPSSSPPLRPCSPARVGRPLAPG